ncbi:PAS domain S-box protein [Rhodovastum atsumiense]|nr:PAS domain S-box protein [Rhodovastum atsumiense]
MGAAVFGAYKLVTDREHGAAAAAAWVEHTYEVIRVVDGILTGAEDVKTGQRGFLLTGEAEYLEPYQEGSETIWRHLAKAQDLTADNPRQQDRLRILEGLLRARGAVSAKTIELAQSGDRQAALDTVWSRQEKHLMDAARRTAAEMVAEEQSLLEAGRAERQRLQGGSVQVLAGLLLAAGFGITLAVAVFARSFAASTIARRAATAAAERQRLLDMMDIAAIMVRDLDGAIRFWSEGCRRLYGWTAEEALGQSAHDLLRTAFPVPLSDIEATLLRDGEWTGDVRQRSRDGSEVVVATRKVLRRFPDGEGFAVMENMTDVTRLREAESRMRNLLDMMDLAAVMVRDPDGTIRFWSEGCRRLYGWTAKEALGQSAHDLLRTAFSVPLADIEAALLRDGEWTGELRQNTKEGTEVVVSSRKVLRREAGEHTLAIMENVTDITALHRVEATLRETQAELRSVLDTAAEGIVVAHADGRIVSVNRATLRMFGYDRPEDLVGRDLGVLMPAAEAARHGAHIAAHRAGAPPRVIGVPGRELMAVRRDGSEFPIDLSVSSFGTGDRRCLTGIIRDATARKQAEAAVRDSEARLRLVQQVGGIAFTDRSFAEDTVLVSPEFARLYGLPPGQPRLPATATITLVHPEDCERMKAEAGDIYAKGGAFASEFRIRRPDGAVHWVAMRAEVFLGPDGRPERAISAQQDITEIVAAREDLTARKDELERCVAERTAALAAAEARFRAIFDSQFQFIGLLSSDGTLLEANRTALEAGGLARDDTVGRPFWETGWWPATERDRLRREIAEAARGAVIRREVEVLGAGGRRILIDFSLKPVRDDATGEIMWIIPEGRDITEQRDLSGQLAQAQKVQALGQLAGGIAHDFNNILQAVSGAATLIERRPEDHEKTRRLARAAIDASVRGVSITQRLLSFARRGEFRTEVLVPAELLHNVREVLAHTLGTTITVRDMVAGSVPSLLADRGQLETALVNLGTNARDAMPDGGTLTLSAEAEHVGEGDRHPVGLAPGAYVRLSVTDTGTGMDAATIAKATDPFFTTKPPGHGTGLGLPMVKGFAEQSGGAMSITSTPGSGTAISLWLRQATGDAVWVPTDEGNGYPALDTSARILLIDDDDLVRETLAAQLEDLGFETLTGASGAEAIALLDAGEIVDALVSDLSMPDMNGVMTIQHARERRPKMPCFLLTGYVGERAALSGKGDFTLVRKPVSAQALAARIEASLKSAKR